MEKTEIGFRTIVSMRAPAMPTARTEMAETGFWALIQRELELRFDEKVTDDTVEARIERELPRTLHRQLVRHFVGTGDAAPIRPPRTVQGLDGVFFASGWSAVGPSHWM